MHFLTLILCCLPRTTKSLAGELKTSSRAAEPAAGSCWCLSHSWSHRGSPGSGLAQPSLEVPCGGIFPSCSGSVCTAGPPASVPGWGTHSTGLNTKCTWCPLLRGPQPPFHLVPLQGRELFIEERTAGTLQQLLAWQTSFKWPKNAELK